MRALAPLPALFFLAALAAAFLFGCPTLLHADPSVSPIAPVLPKGRCTGGAPRVSAPAVPANDTALDLRTDPIADTDRRAWETIGYRFDDGAGRLLDPGGVVVTHAHIAALNEPFDAATQRLDPAVWQSFVASDFRLDEKTCYLMGPNGAPLDIFTMLLWQAASRRHGAHMAMEALLANLEGLGPEARVPFKTLGHMSALALAGTDLPENIKTLLQNPATRVGHLRAPTQAAYAESTRFFDGQRTGSDFLLASIPGSEPGVDARRKGIPDPHERKLGKALSAAFNAKLMETKPGQELLSRFRGPKGLKLPDVMVLKLTQKPDDPGAPGAVYDFSSDRMTINHWEIVKALQARLPPKTFASIQERLADAAQVSRLLAERPSLMRLLVESLDVMYFHELVHGAQSRRSRWDDESLRGNLPGVNPLAKEHEAHREHCRYTLSKSPAELDRTPWRDYCLGLIVDPAAFKDAITRQYLSTFTSSAELDDISSLQAVRRKTARFLAASDGIKTWHQQELKQTGFDLGDKELSAFRTDVDRRERDFLAALPALGRQAGSRLLAYYEKTGAADQALRLALSLPRDAFDGGEKRLNVLTDRAVDWLARNTDPNKRDERLALSQQIIGRFQFMRHLPTALFNAYERDARSKAEELLAQAIQTPTLREELLERAEAWTGILYKPGDLPARIQRAREKKTK